MYKVLNIQRHRYLSDFCVKFCIWTLRSAGSITCKLVVPQQICWTFFLVSGLSPWNSLPDNVKSSTSVDIIKFRPKVSLKYEFLFHDLVTRLFLGYVHVTSLYKSSLLLLSLFPPYLWSKWCTFSKSSRVQNNRHPPGYSDWRYTGSTVRLCRWTETYSSEPVYL